MNKTFLVIGREYVTRVRKRTFIISTILFPLLYLGLIFGTGYIAEKTSRKLHVALIDSSGYFDKATVAQANLLDSSSYVEYVTLNADSVAKNYSALGYDAYIVIPQLDWQKGANNLVLKTDKTYGVAPVMQVESKLNTIWTKIKSEKLGIDEGKRQILSQSKISIDAKCK